MNLRGYMTADEILGQEIRSLRKGLSMTGCELAKNFGISQQHLSRIERGEVQWSISFLIKVCVFFDIPMIYFIKLIEKETSYFSFDKQHIYESYEITTVSNHKDRR